MGFWMRRPLVGDRAMSSVRVPLLVSAVCIVVAVTGSNAGDGFKFPNLNPFARKPAESSTASSTPRRTEPAKPSALSTWSRNTRQSIADSTRWMNPWARPKMPESSPNLTGGRRSPTSPKREEPKEPNWLARMFGAGKPEEERVDTVPDWLNSPRPSY